ncbi:MAG: TIGR03118 family protein, partial [Terriglobales bacterium]
MLKLLSVPRCSRVITLLGFLAIATSLPMFAQHFTRTELTVDLSSLSPNASNLDGHLQNSWGLTRSATSAWWVADNHTGFSTLYDAAGVPQSLVVSIPTLDGSSIAAPTGTAFNYSSGFEIAPGKKAIFLFVTEDGTISGWNPGVQPTAAVIAFPRPGGKPGSAVYKGCTLATTAEGTFLYVSNFGEVRVDVFDSTFHRLNLGPNAFRDPSVPKGFAPFNVQNVGGNLVVTFAKKQKGSDDEAHGPGLGFVAIFDPQGRLLLDLQRGPFLNAPWGITQAPSD